MTGNGGQASRPRKHVAALTSLEADLTRGSEGGRCSASETRRQVTQLGRSTAQAPCQTPAHPATASCTAHSCLF